MSASQTHAAVLGAGGRLRLQGGRLQVLPPSGGLPKGLRAALADHREAVADRLLRPWVRIHSGLVGEDIVLLRNPAVEDYCRRRFPDLTLWMEQEISALPEDPGLVRAAWIAKKHLGGRLISVPQPAEASREVSAAHATLRQRHRGSA